MMRFSWDRAKAESNARKHGVSFETATRVFADPYALMRQDRIENGEWRWQTLGRVDGHLLLLVAHTVLDDQEGVEEIRMISARRADRKERTYYEQNCLL